MSDKVHPSQVVFLMDDSVRAIRAVYEEVDEAPKQSPRMAYGEVDNRPLKLKGYMFKTMRADLVKGDLITVPTNTRHGFTVCKIVSVEVEPDLDATTDIKWVVDKVETSNYFLLLAQEAKVAAVVRDAAKREQRMALKESLQGLKDSDMQAISGMLGKDVNVPETEILEAEEGPAST